MINFQVTFVTILFGVTGCLLLNGCAVVTVADAAVSVVGTVVDVGASAVSVTAHVVSGTVNAVTPSSSSKK
jgi:uncharacterized Tic20 family protein